MYFFDDVVDGGGDCFVVGVGGDGVKDGVVYDYWWVGGI